MTSGLPGLGIDGGRNGAIMMLRSPIEALAGIRWKRVTRQGQPAYLIRLARREPDGRIFTLNQVVRTGHGLARTAITMLGPIIAMEPKMHIACEDVYVPHGRGKGGPSIKTAITLAKFVGGLASPFEPLDAEQDLMWVKAADWRKVILGLSHFTKRDEAKRVSLLILPERIRYLGDIEAKLRRTQDERCDDVTDAAGLAAYALLKREGRSFA